MIQEKIREHADKMCVTYALKNYPKFVKLEEEIRRNIKRELNGNHTILFTSQDVRALIIQLYKTHRAINKSINFVKFGKRFDKYEMITDKELKEQTYLVCDYMACARELQSVYSLLNYDATILYFIELQLKQKKEKDDKYFTDELTKLIKNL